jgi:hypothetical protein
MKEEIQFEKEQNGCNRSARNPVGFDRSLRGARRIHHGFSMVQRIGLHKRILKEAVYANTDRRAIVCNIDDIVLYLSFIH